MKKASKILCVLFSLTGFSTNVWSQDTNTVTLSHKISFWGSANFQRPLLYQLGIRYIPDLNIEHHFSEYNTFNAEISWNVTASPLMSGKEYIETFSRISPYRFWMKYSTPNWEIRAGLQKINFGSATILRPLMWFDQVDPRDPLQLTDGVYGLLGRYYFNSNANIWLWSLYGNDAARGWDYLPSDWRIPEFGGRVQIPVKSGEIAISYHHRKVDFTHLKPDTTYTGSVFYPENKIGFDGKWDALVGVWFEAVIKQNNPQNPFVPEWEDYLNVGVDYTFGIGNGLGAMFEFFRLNSSENLLGQGSRTHFSALSLNYPLGLMNSFSCILFYNWDEHGVYRFINLQRTYDNWTFYVMAFWNPDQYSLYTLSQEHNLFAGKGVQFMAVWDF